MAKKKIDFREMVRNSPEADLMTDFLEYRYKKGFSTMILVSGARGTGKSSTCFRISEKYNERINPFRKKKEMSERNVGTLCRSHIDFIKFVKEAKEGDDCVLEEIGVLYPSRRSMADESVSAGQIFDVIRKKRLVIFANCPLAKSTDKQIRLSSNALILTYKIINSQGVVLSRFWKLQPNFFNGKIYVHKFKRTHYERGKRKKSIVNFMYTKKPNKDLWNWYEGKKDDFIDDTYDRLLKKAEKKREKEAKELGLEEEKPKDLPNPNSMQPAILDEARKGYYNQEELTERVMKKLNKKFTTIALNKNIMRLRRKGYDIREYKINAQQ